ncbi:DUF4157 domain-containing protein [Streptomyces sp. NPDC057197]|uniref:eCIS core domain-containing protein n=1 Tax=unclassified Streptomyces TaxID=2593676 RepID=UPI0009A0D8BC
MRARPQDNSERDTGTRPVKDRTGRPPAAAGPEAASLLHLQRTAGNAAVARMLDQERHSHGPGCGHGTAADEAAPVQRSAVHEVLRTPGAPLEPGLRSEMEARLGADFSDVRMHTDQAARRSAAEIGARAYTSGSHVVVGEGGADRHTLAHELTHVVQQRQGPVAGTDHGDGLRVSDPSDRFEREAEANAHRVLAAALPTTTREDTGGTGGAAQRRSAPEAAVQRAAVQRAPSFRQTEESGESDRDAALRMLDRVARTAERVILATDPRAGKKFTPHLAVNLLPDGTLGIAGNTGKRVVTEQQRQAIDAEVRGFAGGAAPRAGHHGWGSAPAERQRERQDRSKLRALDAGSYAAQHTESPELDAIRAALHKPLTWYAISAPVKKGVPAQHGEMTLLGEQVAAWKKAPRDPGDPKTVYMGGVKLACVACQWAFEAVNEHIGRQLGYRVVAAGAHGQFFPNWLMPQWMRGERAVVDEIRSRAGDVGARLTGEWVVDGDMAKGDFVHVPPDSESEYESD